MTEQRATQLRAALKDFSFMVGSKIQAFDWPDSQLWLIVLTVPGRCANKRYEPNKIVTSMFFSDSFIFQNGHLHKGNLKSALRMVTRMYMDHECDEWLRYKGRRIVEAHR